MNADPLAPLREEAHLARHALETLAFEPAAAPDHNAAHLRACVDCAQQVASLRAERDRFLAQRPAAAFVERVTERAHAPRPPIFAGLVSPLRLVWVGLASAVVVTVVLWAPPAVRHKGSAGVDLQIFVSRAGEAAQPHGGEPLHAGDVLRFGVKTAQGGFVRVANLDDQGRVTHYYPQPRGASSELAGSTEWQYLPGSIELDAFVGLETIWLMITPEPIDAALVEQALGDALAGAGGRLETIHTVALPGQVAFALIRKEAR